MKLQEREGILYPKKMKFGSWIVSGPPGCGKSYLINKIGGWPEEIAIDITIDGWWSIEALTHRPREIHLALPFKGIEETRSVYDEKWLTCKSLPSLDYGRLQIPNKKTFILAPNWRSRFVFDFILPPPSWLFLKREERLASDDVRLVDMRLTPEWVAWQVHTYWKLAWFFHKSGLQVMARPFNTARPFSFPTLKKISAKKGALPDKVVAPSLNWSKVINTLLWIHQTAPDSWRTKYCPAKRAQKSTSTAAKNTLQGKEEEHRKHGPGGDSDDPGNDDIADNT